MHVIGTPKRLKRLAPKGLMGRSILIIVLPLVLVQGVSTYIFYNRHWDVVTQRMAYSLAGDIALVVDYLHRHPDDEQRRWIFARARADMQLSLKLEPNRALPKGPTTTGDAMFLDAFAIAMNALVDRPFSIDVDSMERDVRIYVQIPEGLLRVVTTKKRLFSSTTYIFVLWMLGTSVIVLVIALLFMRNQVRSMRRLAVAADAVGKGGDIDHFKVEGAAEVRQAARAFELMRERLRRQIDQRTEMLAGVSHDLRTPLTRMKLELAMLESVEGIEALRGDVLEMEKMIDAYLAFARGEGTEQPADTDIASLLDKVVRGYRRQGASVDFHPERDATLSLKAAAMERALSNVVGNAVRYAGHVAVRGGLRGEAYEIIVDDDGPGVPQARREDVFKAFVRLENSRNPATGGSGLGLTMARDVVRGHGGDIHLEDSPMGGLRVRITLPL